MAYEELAAAIVAIIGAIAATIRRRAKVRHAAERSAPRAVAARRAQIAILEGLALDLGCQRVQLCVAHNGHRHVTPESALSMTVLGEAVAPSLPARGVDTQGRPLLDAAYLEILSELDADEVVQRGRAEIPPRSWLRDEMEADHIDSAVWSVVSRAPKGLYFVVCARRGLGPSDAVARSLIRSACQRLAEQLKRPARTAGFPVTP